MFVFDFLVSALIGYIIRIKWVLVLLVVYFVLLILGALTYPQLFVKYLNVGNILVQTGGLLLGAFLRSLRDKNLAARAEEERKAKEAEESLKKESAAKTSSKSGVRTRGRVK